nr:gamma hordein [Hordeum vulgare subsp. vulgare]
MKILIILTILAMATTFATSEMQVNPSVQVQPTQQQPYPESQQPFISQSQQQFPQPQQPFPQQPQQPFPQSQQQCLQQPQHQFPQPTQQFPQRPLLPFTHPFLTFPDQLLPQPPHQSFPQPPQSYPQPPLQPFPQPPQQKYPEQPQQPFPWQQPTIQLYLQQQLNPCKEFLLQQCRPVSLLSYIWSKIVQQSSCRVMQQQCCLQLAQIPEQYKCTAIDSIVHAIFMQQGQRQGVQIVQQQPQPQQVGQCVLVQGQGVVQPQQLAQMEAIRTLVLQSVPSMCNFNVPPNCSTIKAPFVGVVTQVGGQ